MDEALKPSKELNERIAREVLGWHQHPDYKHLWYPRRHVADPATTLPDFSGDMKAAQVIIDQLKADITLHGLIEGGRHRVGLRFLGGREVIGDGDTKPAAICAAALKALKP